MSLRDDVVKNVDDYLASDEFRRFFRGEIDKTVLDIIRKSPDRGLTYRGFMMKMSVEIFDAAGGHLSFDEAKQHASTAYREFRADNKPVKFGAPEWDWSGASARLLAREYAIDYWEPSP